MKTVLAAIAVVVGLALGATACGSGDNGGVIDQRSTTTLSSPNRY